MKAALYARVSKDDQHPENQLIELRRFAESRKWEFEEFIDEGLGGSLTKEKRPRLKAMMESAHRGKVRVVVVWRFDRFARSMSQLVNALDEFRDWGVDFISLNENIDTSTSHGRMLFGIFAAFAEFERSLIQERTKAGLRRAVVEGKTLGRPRISVRKNKPTVDPEAIIARAQMEELTVRKLGDIFNVGKSTVARILRQARLGLSQNPPPKETSYIIGEGH